MKENGILKVLKKCDREGFSLLDRANEIYEDIDSEIDAKEESNNIAKLIKAKMDDHSILNAKVRSIEKEYSGECSDLFNIIDAEYWATKNKNLPH